LNWDMLTPHTDFSSADTCFSLGLILRQHCCTRDAPGTFTEFAVWSRLPRNWSWNSCRFIGLEKQGLRSANAFFELHPIWLARLQNDVTPTIIGRVAQARSFSSQPQETERVPHPFVTKVFFLRNKRVGDNCSPILTRPFLAANKEDNAD
jgi:hypothetical protein